MRRRDLSKVKLEPVARGNMIAFKKPGAIFRGVYVKARKVKNENGETFIHTLNDAKGEPWSIWESSALKVLGAVKPGGVVEIKYLGKKKSTRSKYSYNNFQVSVEPGYLKKDRV